MAFQTSKKIALGEKKTFNVNGELIKTGAHSVVRFQTQATGLKRQQVSPVLAMNITLHKPNAKRHVQSPCVSQKVFMDR